MKKYAFITLFFYSFIYQIQYSQCTSSINAIQFSDDTLCGIGYVDITIDGGSLGNSTSWQLFTGNCGGTLINKEQLIQHLSLIYMLIKTLLKNGKNIVKVILLIYQDKE